ncbi:Wadjet anti-phage system protein JetD domain-containing protein [Stenotrophomonas indicatrix]|uniref:Wadjet anti-phage system protein JetD domain-containing protein n=1 Tax=Stenotrophomonas indicatrix TaxID=2045451 RepID=UPI0020062E29|nr:Wadjet anti-phage system protein JetD domain-containing protein [Stenotrophomonas indicatrix]MCK6231493.1 DUF2220 domain-containing protein [Stenotrophomonas indicatrix]
MLADTVLGALLVKAERYAIAGKRTARENVGELKEYWALPLQHRDAFHERIRAAHRRGAIDVKWSKQGGDDKTVEKIAVLDIQALAGFLGAKSAEAELREATELLSPWIDRSSRVKEILDRWAQGMKVRGQGPNSARSFADALRVLDALALTPGEDQVVRRISVRLFSNSKHIEKLKRPLDLLTNDTLLAPARKRLELFNELGLVKEPQPFLAAGSGVLRLQDDQNATVFRPFLGVAGKTIIGYSGDPAWVLSIENLTTFHLCSQLSAARDGLIVYTGGMPSPAWANAYSKILEACSPSIQIFHWGDIDAGGFRIAARIREIVPATHQLLPWLMDPRELPHSIENQEAEPATKSAMVRHAMRAGWPDLAAGLDERRIEQEAIEPRLPSR